MGQAFIKLALLIGAVAIALSSHLLSSIVTYPVHETGAIVISGASTGIGRHAAEALAQKGYVVFAGVRTVEDAQEVVKAHPNIISLQLDVTKADSIEKAQTQVKEELSSRGGLPLIGLVNNAGIAHMLPIELVDIDKYRELLDVNVIGVMALTQAFIPLLRQSQGRIVNIGSAAGLVVAPMYGAYASSKFALEAITDATRLELAAWNISVSILEPGTVESKIREKNMGENAAHRKLSPEKRALYANFFDHFDVIGNKLQSLSSPPSITTEAIIHAMISPHPKTRYVVGSFRGIPLAAATKIIPFIPDRLLDQLRFMQRP